MYSTIVENTIKPNQTLNCAIKYIIAMTMSTIVGVIENNMYESRLSIESVPRSITLRTSPVFLAKCQRNGKS